MALVDIANNAGGKIGGFGDQVTGEALITAALLTADDDKVSQWINIKYPVVRKKVIADFAAMGCPFRETLKFADLGDDIKADDVDISTVVSSGGVVTVTTDSAHGRSTGDTVFLADIEGTLVDSLNGTTPTITVVDTTSFTLDSVTGTASWDHTEDTGIVSYCPEMGSWNYAFNLPSDYFAMVRHCDESYTSDADYTVRKGVRKEYQYQTILNKDGDGLLLLTNDLTNSDTDSAYIEYCIDQTDFDLFSPALEECIAMLLAVELCPILGRNLEVRQRLLVEYEQITVPEAKRNIQSQQDNSARTVHPDYSGGRSSVLRGTGNDRNNYGYTAI
jgi:hypothetical protein